MKPKNLRTSDMSLDIQTKFLELEQTHHALKEKTKDLSGKRRENPTYKRLLKFDSLISNWRVVSGIDNPTSLAHPETFEEFKEFVKRSFANKSKAELLDAVCSSVAISYRLRELLKVAEKNMSCLLSVVSEQNLQTAKSEQNRKTGKNKKELADEEHLDESLQTMLKELGREPSPEDFPKFVRTLKAKYPHPLYVKKPRLTKEEKLLPKEEIEIILEMKADPNWKDGRLRDFWKDQTGLDATTKKLSTLK